MYLTDVLNLTDVFTFYNFIGYFSNYVRFRKIKCSYAFTKYTAQYL